MDIWGWHAVFAAVENNTIQRLYMADTRRGSDARYQRLSNMAKQNRIPVMLLSRHAMDERWGKEHQGIVGELTPESVAKTYSETDLDELLAIDAVDQKVTSPLLILVLDGIQDPHNLGACMRSAGAAQVTCIIAPKDKSVGLTPAVRKVACGAAERIPFIQVTNLARTIQKLQSYGVWVYGMDQEATKTIYEIKFPQHLAIIMGSEEHGMRRLTFENCDEIMKIPMPGNMESLNVSVATGIALFEVRRQNM